MNDAISKSLLIGAAVLAAPVLMYLAYSRPEYLTSQTYIGGLLLLELFCIAVWLYRRIFFAVLMVTFLLAGVQLPVGSLWTMGRWLLLGIGALVGTTLMLKERRYHFGSFHLLAFFAVLAALVSAAVSRYITLSCLKVLSLFLLFLYAATGARLAVLERENRFFDGLLIGCEAFVAIIGSFYLLGREVMGNPNSLGAVMGVVAAPLLLWGTLLKQDVFSHRRRLLLLVVALYLTFASHARASMLAAAVSSGLLCIALRRYRLLASGVAVLAIVVAASAILQPEVFSNTMSALTSNVLYKGKDPSGGLLDSRKSPWQDTIDTIRSHFWFGTGFGTVDTGKSLPDDIGKFASSSTTSAEHGSSYLEIVAWVGILGVLPFVILLAYLLAKILKVFFWMHRTADPLHPAVPLAVVLLAGFVHAAFEDWMFAAGYYLCTFFWSMAFVFIDQIQFLPLPAARMSFARREYPHRQFSVSTSGQ